MSVIKNLALLAQRFDKKVVVQVPATPSRKAYSYEKNVSESSESTVGKPPKGKKVNVPGAIAGSLLVGSALGVSIAGSRGQQRRANRGLAGAYENHKKNVEELNKAYQAKKAKEKVEGSAKDRDEAYSTLGVDKDASQEDIGRAYKKLARKYHPDVNKSEEGQEVFKKVNAAMDILDDRRKAARGEAQTDRVERTNSAFSRIDAFVEDLKARSDATTVQVPATAKRKAYSYTKNGKGSDTEGFAEPIKRVLPNIAAIGALTVAGTAVNSKLYGKVGEKANQKYREHEENARRQYDITDEDLEEVRNPKKAQKKSPAPKGRKPPTKLLKGS